MPQVRLLVGGNALAKNQALVRIQDKRQQAHHHALLGLGRVLRERQSVVGVIRPIHVGNRQLGFVNGGFECHCMGCISVSVVCVSVVSGIWSRHV